MTTTPVRTEPVDFGVGSFIIGQVIADATPGSILFADANSALGQDNANLFWDDTNNRLGLLGNSPSDTIDVGAGGTVRIRDITQGSILFATTAGVLEQDNTNLFWNNTNKRLGIGTAAPISSVHILEDTGGILARLLIQQSQGSGGGGVAIDLNAGIGHLSDVRIGWTLGTQVWNMGIDQSFGNAFRLSNGALGGTNLITVLTAGNIIFGGASAGFGSQYEFLHTTSHFITIFDSANPATTNVVGWQAGMQTQSPTTNRIAARVLGNFDNILDASRVGRLRLQVADGGDPATRLVIAGSNVGIGVPDGTAPTQRLDVNGEIALSNFLNFDTKAVPADPATEEARLYLKTQDANNNELAAKIKTNNAIAEVIITSPQGRCRECGYEGRTKDPRFDTVEGKMTIEFYCGHRFTLEVLYL